MQKKLFWMVMVVSLLCLGCPGPEESPTIYVHQEMLPYCWFPNGGYWVYQEVNTPGWLDSTYSVGSPSISIIPDSYNEGFQSESYKCATMIRGRLWGRGIYAWGYGEDFQYSYSEVNESYTDSSGEKRDQVFFWDTHYPDTLLSYPTTFVKHRFDSIVVQGQVYYDAIQVVTDPAQVAEHSFEVVWVKGVGIVRRSMVDGTIWELVRYRIHP